MFDLWAVVRVGLQYNPTMFGFMFSGLYGGRYSYGLTTGEARNIAEETTRGVERRLEALEMSCAALWQLLKDKNGYTDAELIEEIHKLDAMDGQINGRVGQSAQVCPNCGHKLLTRSSPKCSWCGAPLSPHSI